MIERALLASVNLLIVTGATVEQSRQAIELAQRYESICFATVGLHPHHAGNYSTDILTELKDLCQHKSVVAVGECGLDFNRNYSSRKDQLRAFEAQLELAVDCQKPVFLHQREAHKDFLSIIKHYRSGLKNAVVHCFTDGPDEAEAYLDLDMYIGVTGWITDERRGQALQAAVKHVPLDRIMLETDAPYLFPRNLNIQALKKGRNEPYYLPEIAKVVAKKMQISEAVLGAAAYKNSRLFFKV